MSAPLIILQLAQYVSLVIVLCQVTPERMADGSSERPETGL